MLSSLTRSTHGTDFEFQQNHVIACKYSAASCVHVFGFNFNHSEDKKNIFSWFPSTWTWNTQKSPGAWMGAPQVLNRDHICSQRADLGVHPNLGFSSCFAHCDRHGSGLWLGETMLITNLPFSESSVKHDNVSTRLYWALEVLPFMHQEIFVCASSSGGQG